MHTIYKTNDFHQMIQPEDIAKLTPQVGPLPPATLCACHHGLGVSQRRGGSAYGGLGLRGGAGLDGNPLTNRDVKIAIIDIYGYGYWWLMMIDDDEWWWMVINC